MPFDLGKVREYFPLPKFRPGQEQAIERVLESFEKYKVVLLEGPTGSGKSAIGYTIAQYANDAYYLCPQKFLQDQLTADFGQNGKSLGSRDPMIDLKGRVAYPCTYYDRMLDDLDPNDEKFTEFQHKVSLNIKCDRGECKRQGKSKIEECCDENMRATECPYFARMYEALSAKICLMNFHAFLFQTSVVFQFPDRELLILDECFHPLTKIMTSIGMVEIGKLVNQQVKCDVLSFNKKEQKLEFKPIIRYLKRKKQMTYKVIAGNYSFYATLDHKIYTQEGIRRLKDVRVGDKVITNNPELNDIQKQLILGGLLGDSNVHIIKRTKFHEKGRMARVRFQHGPKQEKYLDWKYNIIREHTKTRPKTVRNGGFTKTIRRFATRCSLYDHISVVLRKNKKNPNMKWLNQITDFGLAIWYMDDGSLSGGVASFHTEGFGSKENDTICRWLKKQGFPARKLSYVRRNKKLFYISIGRDGARLLAHKISRFTPSFMRYKLPDGDFDEYDNNIENIRSLPFSSEPIKSITPYKESSTYDLEIADNHNYFAGKTLVSNCHTTEDVLMKFVEFRMSDRRLLRHNIRFPQLETIEEYMEFFEEIDLAKIISEEIKLARVAMSPDDEDEWVHIAIKYKMLQESSPENWVLEWEESKDKISRTIILRPIFISEYAHRYLFDKAKHVLMMSATILSKEAVCESLGLEEDEVHMLRLPCMFPAENRKIIVRPSGSMSYSKKEATFPKLIADVNAICKEHQDERGIIHTHNFEICNKLLKECRPEVKARFLYQNDNEFEGNKNLLIKKHKASKNTIIIAPAMHEGLDLTDDLGRFQIICKMPYPSMADPQIARRMELSPAYYEWRTATKLVQSYGRICRHENDFGVTYILDKDFINFFNRSKYILPGWFKDAIQK